MIKTKICGLKTLEDIEIVNRYKPDYIGFVFAKTKRFVTDEQALVMKMKLDVDIKAVGVFVNEPIEHIVRLYQEKIIDLAQLHGNETDEYISKLKEKADIPVIKAIKVQTKEQVIKEMSFLADVHLFDTYKKGIPGGTGERFDLDILNEALKERPLDKYFLAGGITPENVEDILKFEFNKADFIGLDISSGVETDGKKDEEKIRSFLEKVRTI